MTPSRLGGAGGLPSFRDVCRRLPMSFDVQRCTDRARARAAGHRGRPPALLTAVDSVADTAVIWSATQRRSKPISSERWTRCTTSAGAAGEPVGDLSTIGDTIRDLTIWWSNRVYNANHAALDSLRGQTLTPIDPLADDVVRDLYGKILLITIPLLTWAGSSSAI
jgi:hypothetical protein